MKSYADLIPTGLLAMLGEDDKGLMLEDVSPEPQQAFPQAGGFGPQGRWGERAQKLPYIPSPENLNPFAPSSAAAQGSHARDFFNRYPLDQAPGPIESHIQLYGDKPQQAQGAQAGQEPYYMVGRRPLGKPGGMGSLIFNGPKGGVGYDHNARLEHQHFIGSDGSNFGLDSSGVFTEPPERLGEYQTNVPGLEGRKMKASYIDSARKKVEQRWQEIERSLQDANKATPFYKGMRQELNRYHLLGYNCQSYVDDVISEAEKAAKRNGESLYFD